MEFSTEEQGIIRIAIAGLYLKEYKKLQRMQRAKKSDIASQVIYVCELERLWNRVKKKNKIV